jgi:hypothetical protein
VYFATTPTAWGVVSVNAGNASAWFDDVADVFFVKDQSENAFAASLFDPGKWSSAPGGVSAAAQDGGLEGTYNVSPTTFYTTNGNYAPGIPVTLGDGATGNSSVVQVGDYTGDGFNAIAIFNGSWAWSSGSGIQNYTEPTDENPTNLEQSPLSPGVLAFVPGWGSGTFVLACNNIGFSGNWWSGPAINLLPYTDVLSSAQIAADEAEVLSSGWAAQVASYAPGMVLPGAYPGTTLEYLNNVVYPFVWPYISPAPNNLEPTPPNQIITAEQGGNIQYLKQVVIYISVDGNNWDQVFAGSNAAAPSGGSAPTPTTNSYSIPSGSFFSNLLGTTTYEAFTFYTVSYSGGSPQTVPNAPTPQCAAGGGVSPGSLPPYPVDGVPRDPTDVPIVVDDSVTDPSTNITVSNNISVDPFFGATGQIAVTESD